MLSHKKIQNLTLGQSLNLFNLQYQKQENLNEVLQKMHHSKRMLSISIHCDNYPKM